MKKANTNLKGFTIIEVVLVLAIAGLIFMMVFIALPALQRSQRDTQRSNDIARVSTAINNYQANNRGKIPSKGKYVKGHETPDRSEAVTADTITSWKYFYDNYLIVNSAGSQDVFADPDGGFYSLYIDTCKTTGITANQPCTVGQRFNVSFDEQSIGNLYDGTESAAAASDTSADGEIGHSISILTNATCQGEIAYYSSGSRKVAILYKKEGGGAICVNN